MPRPSRSDTGGRARHQRQAFLPCQRLGLHALVEADLVLVVGIEDLILSEGKDVSGAVSRRAGVNAPLLQIFTPLSDYSGHVRSTRE